MEESRVLTIRDTMEVAEHFAKSGLFPKTVAEQAFVKIMAGQELGIPPFAAMSGIHVIQGQASVGANLIAGRIKASGKYDYRIIMLNDEGCELEFSEQGEVRGLSIFNATNAKDAGLLSKDNWRKFPRNMLFARAISNGARWYCPDVFSGPVYTPEELGGDVVDAKIVDVTPAVIEGQPEPESEDTEDAPHWIDDEAQRGNFWRAAGGMAYDNDEVHLTLDVESMRDYTGTAGEALTALSEHRKAHTVEQGAML